jgi:hypothetical protein
MCIRTGDLLVSEIVKGRTTIHMRVRKIAGG